MNLTLPAPVCILRGGPDCTIIDRTGKKWLFEDHPYCGPSVLNRKTLEIMDKEPGPRSPFWEAVQRWYDTGKRIVDGLCVWEPKKEPKLKHLGGNHYLVIEWE
jgi:hypothetical protein